MIATMAYIRIIDYLSRSRWQGWRALARRLAVCAAVAAGFAAVLGLGACMEDGTVTCASGLRCPPDKRCTADGNECTATLCGNGVIDEGEACDDGNITPNDGCNSTCEALFDDCGDGIVDRDRGEICDCGVTPGLNDDPLCQDSVNDDARGYCAENCRPNCNDNQLDEGEECDGAERTNTGTCISRGFDRGSTSCSTQCRIELDDCHLIGWIEEIDTMPLAGNLSHIWRAEDGSMFAAGNQDGHGMVLLYQNQDWHSERVISRDRTSLYGIWGFDSDDIFAVGEGGAIAHYNGGAWIVNYQDAGNTLRAISGQIDASSSLWAVGDDETALRYNRALNTWESDPRPGQLIDDIDGPDPDSSGNDFHGVWGPASDEVYVVGNHGLVLHYRDDAWVREAEGLVDATLLKVWGIDDLVFAAGESGTLLMRDADGWQVIETSINRDILEIWGQRPDRVFAVGRDGAVMMFDGNTWRTTRTLAKTPSLTALVADDEGILRAVDRNGRLWRYSDQAWLETATVPNEEHINASWAAGPNELYTAMANGTILRFADNRWSTVLATPMTPSLHGIWGTSDGTLYAVGNDSTVVEVDPDGSARAVALPPETPSRTLHDIWGSADDQLFVVGDTDPNDPEALGVILMRLDGVWTLADHTMETGIHAVWGRRADNVYAVGEGGRVQEWNGSSWKSHLSIFSGTLYGIWGSGPDDIFAVGEQGVILKNFRTEWRQSYQDSSQSILRDIWSSGDGHFYAAGDNGLLLHYDGEQWSPIREQTTTRLRTVSGAYHPTEDAKLLSFMGEDGDFFQLTIHDPPTPDEAALRMSLAE